MSAIIALWLQDPSVAGGGRCRSGRAPPLVKITGPWGWHLKSTIGGGGAARCRGGAVQEVCGQRQGDRWWEEGAGPDRRAGVQQPTGGAAAHRGRSGAVRPRRTAATATADSGADADVTLLRPLPPTLNPQHDITS